MWNEEELPEGDLWSVYGAEAVYVRSIALLDRLMQHQIEGIARMDRLLTKQLETKRELDALQQRLTRPEEPQQNSS